MISSANKYGKAILSFLWIYVLVGKILPRILLEAYTIRTISIREYGLIIHEFDPYFNFRATEYLYEHGWKKFVTWFDYMSWYPLGRPVGTTIYPGMQVTAVWIKRFIMGDTMSLNDVCVYIPAWFGVIATIFTGLLAYECSLPAVSKPGKKTEAPFGSVLSNIPLVNLVYDKVIVKFLQATLNLLEYIAGTDFGLRQNKSCNITLSSPALEIAVCTTMSMSIVPAHLMRSVGGGYDNESIAITAMTLTFWLWTRSLRGGVDGKGSWPFVWGILTGIGYFYMVAVWGGYVFVLNLIGCHTAFLVLLGRYSSKLHRAYSAFYVVGTTLAIQVPVVGMAPLKSLEQLGPCAVFLGIQLLEIIEWQRRKKGLSNREVWKLRIKLFAAAGLILLSVGYVLIPTGYFGPISSRVRALFVKHTKTGNPLVDSVAEHQPASADAYFQYLDVLVYIAPVGYALIALRYFHDSSSFLIVYATATYFFSLKMVRLILLTAPIVCVLCGVTAGRCVGFITYNLLGFSPSLSSVFDLFAEEKIEVKEKKKRKVSTKKSKGKRNGHANSTEPSEVTNKLQNVRATLVKVGVALSLWFIYPQLKPFAVTFHDKCHQLSKHMSHPTIVQRGRLKSGEEVTVDDYRKCYWWINDNTPKDSRILAWWDYGYQITSIANRTTIADGNTWNHEHIALLGRVLTSHEKEGHRIARHLADYALVWAGGGGDDLAKSPHLARIANSVYRSMCPGDPTCSHFGYTREGPSRMMRESFLFKLHSHKMKPGVEADPNRFQHVFTSPYGKCRIFKILSVSQESKDWVANPKNRVCDAPGSWYCSGQYPPALQKVLDEKKDFDQLEDFNKDGDDSEYQAKYHENLNKRSAGEAITVEKEKRASNGKKTPWRPIREVGTEEREELNNVWENSEEATLLWDYISTNDLKGLMQHLMYNPEDAFRRSSDGRGPMWWAHEYGYSKIIRVLKKIGVSIDLKDANGFTPLSLNDEL